MHVFFTWLMKNREVFPDLRGEETEKRVLMSTDFDCILNIK